MRRARQLKEHSPRSGISAEIGVELLTHCQLVKPLSLSTQRLRLGYQLRLRPISDGLIEVRDNAVHYFNASPQPAKQVLELGTAAVKNFIELARRWFHHDLTRYSLYLMPIGFISTPATLSALPTTPDEHKLVNYLAQTVRDNRPASGDEFSVALEVNLSFKRSAPGTAAAVAVTTDPSAPKVTLSEEDIRKTYPWELPRTRETIAWAVLGLQAH